MVSSWFVLGVLLVLAELVSGRGYAFCLSIVAFVVAYLAYLISIFSICGQVVLFSVLGVGGVVGWWRYLRYSAPNYQEDAFEINSRQYIGRAFTLAQPLVDGMGRTEFDNQIWHLNSRSDIAAGEKVTVYAVNGVILKVEPSK